MRKMTFFVSCTLALAILAVWVLWAPDSSRQIITVDSASEVEDAVAPTSQGDLSLPPHLQAVSAVMKPVIAPTPEELQELEHEVTQMQSQLTKLVESLDANLENEAERKLIEEKYALLTQDYNSLVLQMVKASSHGQDDQL